MRLRQSTAIAYKDQLMGPSHKDSHQAKAEVFTLVCDSPPDENQELDA